MECPHKIYYVYKQNVVQHYSYTRNVAADVLLETMDTIVNIRRGEAACNAYLHVLE